MNKNDNQAALLRRAAGARAAAEQARQSTRWPEGANKMKAAVCREFGEPMSIEDVAIVRAERGETVRNVTMFD